jgi:hypothetical protein
MTEGGIASWKKKEGEAFSTGDVLVEIVSVAVVLTGGSGASRSDGFHASRYYHLMVELRSGNVRGKMASTHAGNVNELFIHKSSY